MSSSCPACHDENVQRLPVAHGAGSGNKAATTGDPAGSGAAGNPPGDLSRRAAPPAKASYLRILIAWFIATLAAPFLVLTLQMPDGAGKYLAYGISIVTVYALLRSYSYNKTKWPLLFERWEHSYICLHCGKIFQR